MEGLGDPKNVPALLALLAPGFIILWFRTRVAEGTTPEFKQQLLYFALVSAAYYAVATTVFDVFFPSTVVIVAVKVCLPGESQVVTR